MGVSGSGKTTLGKALSKKLSIPFFDADDFHPEANIQKMMNNEPLNDLDRNPWLEILSHKITQWENQEGAILACSALKESYRTLLTIAKDTHWVYLKGSYDSIQSRIEKRNDHYMKSGLLQSQFYTLEEPSYGIVIDINKPTSIQVDEIIQYFRMTN